jgi:hypothetical protein
MSNNLRTTPDESADDTAPKQRGVPFKPGQSGNPEGRPKGSRNKLGEAFVQALADDFSEHGVVAVERVRQSDPSTYLKIIGNTLPREVLQLALSVKATANFAEMEDAEGFFEAFSYARQRIGAKPLEAPMIDLTAEAEAAWRTDDGED